MHRVCACFWLGVELSRSEAEVKSKPRKIDAGTPDKTPNPEVLGSGGFRNAVGHEESSESRKLLSRGCDPTSCEPLLRSPVAQP